MRNVELTPDERQLIASARLGYEPSAIERARVRRSLEWKLAAGVVMTITQVAPGLSAAVKITLAVVATGAIVGTGTYFGVRSTGNHEATLSKPAVVAKVAKVPSESPAMALPVGIPVDETTPAPVPVDSPVVPAGPRRREARPTPVFPAIPDLGAEMSLLSTVNTALVRGQVEKALETLAAYDQSFRSGQLAEERAALGVLALCAADRDSEAIRLHKQFLRRWPKSPLAARLIHSCADSPRH